MDLSLRYFLLLILRIALIPIALLASSVQSFAATYTWNVAYIGRYGYPSPAAACANLGTVGTYSYVLTSATGGRCTHDGKPINSYVLSRSGDSCPSGSTYNATTGICDFPPLPTCGPDEFESPINGACLPKQNCPSNATFDPSKNGGEGGCSCNNGTSMVKLDGFSMCMEPLESDTCTPSSSDFAGYINGYAACPGRNRCPNGTKPGFVGEGSTMTPICYPVTGSQDPGCNGSIGMVNGDAVCIPVITADPNCPMGSGVINGETICIVDPNNDPDCPAGSVAGYTGSGADMNKTCIAKSYQPQTCPPGQYIVTQDGSGFGCVTSSTKPPADPAAPPKSGQTIDGTIKPSAGGDGSGGDGSGTAPCPEGQECNGQDIQIKLPDEGLETTIDGLFEDAPNNTYKDDLDEFGQSELDSVLNPDMHFADVRGPDGLFTERSRLEQFTSFVKTHTVGNSTNCNGNLPFLGMTISCEKFGNYNRILGYMLSVFAMMSIYKTLMRPSASGV